MFNKKLITLYFLCILLLFSIPSVSSFASDNAQDNAIKVLVNGEYLHFKELPVEKDGSTLVPMRDIFEALGATLKWDDTTSTVTGTNGPNTIVLQLDNPMAYINGNSVILPVPGTLIENKTMVPTRFIAESMNCVVSWDDNTKTVIIMPNKTIEFEDKNIEKAVKTAINSTKDTLTTSDVALIRALTVDESNIKNLTGIQCLINLETLNLQKNEIQDISLLSGLLKLENLNVSENNISDISPLKGLLNLKELNIESNKISDISLILNNTNLENLSVGYNKITDINALKDITNLKKLNLSYTLVDDISILEFLVNLEQLNLSYTQITDISPLIACSKLMTLNIFSDAVLDISPLKYLENLNSLYYENYSKKTKINDGLFINSAIIVSRANSIINTIITPNMSDLEKELIIHDYLVLNTNYDSVGYLNGTVSNEAHMPFGVLIDGIGVCDGIANSMKALLSMVNIKSLTVYGSSFTLSSSPVGHAWNMVMIDGNYYYLDTTWDDTGIVDKENTLSHTYFNLSTRQISVDHKFDHDFYPLAEKNNVDFDRDIKDNHQIIINEDYTYIINSGYLYKIDNSNQAAVQLSNDKISEIACIEGSIYYINNSDGNKIYAINNDGSGNSCIVSDTAFHIYAVNNCIYYISKKNDNCWLHKMNLDGTNNIILNSDKNSERLTTTLYFNDNILYYKVFTSHIVNASGIMRNESTEFIKANLDGKEHKKIITGFMTGFTVTVTNYTDKEVTAIDYYVDQIEYIVDDWIYYLGEYQGRNIFEKGGNNIYKVKIDGSGQTKLCDDEVYNASYDIVGNWIYYKNAADFNRIYRIKTDGTQRTMLFNQ